MLSCAKLMKMMHINALEGNVNVLYIILCIYMDNLHSLCTQQ